MTDAEVLQFGFNLITAGIGVTVFILLGAGTLTFLVYQRIRGERLETDEQVRKLHERMNEFVRDYVRREDINGHFKVIEGALQELNQQLVYLSERIDKFVDRA